MVQRVAICGAPLTGKTTILTALGRSVGADPIRRSFGDTENIARLDMDYYGKQVAFITISGNFNHTTSKIVAKILSGVHIVIYVCSALPNIERSSSEKKYALEETDRQKLFWRLYTQEAEQVGASWRTIPWIFVLNKVDVGNRNPLSQEIPEALQSEMISCIATQNAGILPLFEKVAQFFA
jgi:hypothetical protein